MSLSPYQIHVQTWKSCTRCHLCQGRQSVVLVRGSIPCDVLFVGEAPGESEDVLGRPFVGPAGHLLDQIINEAFYRCPEYGNQTQTWAMTNLVACIPRDEYDNKAGEPDREAIKACAPRLTEFVAIANPKLIVTVGKLSDAWTPKAMEKLDKRREDVVVKWLSITHPAAILRANVAQQGLAIRKCVVALQNAVEDL